MTHTRVWMVSVYAPGGAEVLYGVESLSTEAHATAYCRRARTSCAAASQSRGAER